MDSALFDLIYGPNGLCQPQFEPDWWRFADLKSPYPWFGGKSSAAELIWSYIGDVKNYVDACAGSLAVPLFRPSEPTIETINDLDGFITNLWRAIQAAPEQAAEACDWPVNEADLHSRHKYMIGIRGKLTARLMADPFFCNARIAGWWIWGLSQWIGGSWCRKPSAQLPSIGSMGQGRKSGGARGVQAMSRQLPAIGGSSRNGNVLQNHGKGVHSKERRGALREVFSALSDRFRFARVTCGDFRRVLTPSVTWKHGLTGVLLDPPYAGFDHLYRSDPIASAARDWCIANGARDDLRIALCGYAGEHTALEAKGWTVESWKARGGYGNQAESNENASKERIWFSPACVKNKAAKQIGMGW